MRDVRAIISTVFAVLCDLVGFVLTAFQSRASLTVENLFLRKQLAFYQEHKVKPKDVGAVVSLAKTPVGVHEVFDEGQEFLRSTRCKLADTLHII